MLGWGVQDHHEQEQEGWRKGPWTPEEDKLLTEYVASHGEGRWSSVAKCAGLNRSGKSCRLRWVNYLRPGLKRGHITPQEEGIIIELHSLWGNKWSTIARFLPGRTDNEIKNYWRTHFKKRDKSLSKKDKIKISQNHKKQQQQQQDPKQERQPRTHQEDMNIINHDQDITSFMYPSNIIAATTIAATSTTAALEDQYHMSQYTLGSCSSDHSSMFDEGFLWGGSLWNLDEGPQGGCSSGGDSRLNQLARRDYDLADNVDVQRIQSFPSCGYGGYSYSEFYIGDHIF